MYLQLFSIFMLAIGEALCIYSEMLIAKSDDWWYNFVLITIAGIPLLLGYHYGYIAFKSMWIVMAVSVASILIVEPMTIWFMFKEVPSNKALLTMGLGVLGLLISLSE